MHADPPLKKPAKTNFATSGLLINGILFVGDAVFSFSIFILSLTHKTFWHKIKVFFFFFFAINN